MNISKRSFFLLNLVILIVPLTGNKFIYETLNLGSLNKILAFGIPGLYFLSFFVDIIKNKMIPKFDMIFSTIMINIIILIISLIFSISHNFYNFTNILNFFYILLFIYSIYVYKFNDKEIKFLLSSIIAIFVVICFLGILQYLFKINLITRGIHKYPGAHGRINSTMYIATILDKFIIINLLLYLVILSKTKKLKLNYNLFFWLLILLGTITLAFTFSRTGIGMFYIITLIFFIIFIFQKKYLFSVLIVIICIILYSIPGQKYVFNSLVLYANNTLNNFYSKTNLTFLSTVNNSVVDFIIPNDNNNQSSSSNNQSSSNNNQFLDHSLLSRNLYSTIAKEIIKYSPIIGIGIGSYNYIYHTQDLNKIFGNDFIKTTHDVKYPHNMYYHYGAETGLLGLIAFIFLLILISYKSNKNNKLLAMLLLLTIGAFNFTESIFYMKELSYFLIIVYSLTLKSNLIYNNITDDNLHK